MLIPVGDHILQEFNTLYLTRFRTYKITYTTTNKNLGGGGGLRQIFMYISAAKSLYMSIFLDNDILLWCLCSLLVHGSYPTA